MASIFQRSIVALKATASHAASLATRPAAAAPEPVVFDKRHEDRLKRQLPCSIVEMEDGTFVTVPKARAISSTADGLKLFGSPSGALLGTGFSQIDIANVKQIAVGVLTDKTDASAAGANAALTTASGGLSATLHPVAASPFTQLEVVMQGVPPVTKGVSEALRICGVAWTPWGRTVAPSFLAAAGLPDETTARDTKLMSADVVGPPY
jgi:hypothetical protein